MKSRKIISIIFALVIVALVLPACASLAKPAIVISSPPSGSTYREGDDVAIQSTSADAAGVVRVELAIDGAVVRNDAPPAPQANFSIIQTWKATAGAHTVIVRAHNAAGTASDPAAISISVSPAAAAPANAPTPVLPTAVAQPPTPIPPTAVPPTSAPTACANNAVFVADVTVPDGTPLSPGQTFNKTWRVKNTGTCAWTTAYDFAFVTGEAMATTTAIAAPSTAPGATADFLVAMTAPTTPGIHAGQWKLRNADNVFFGGTMTANINVINPSAPPPAQPPAPPPATGCSGTPNIASFTAAATTINGGQSTTLNWGAVTGADSVEIDNGIGGVPAPGSTSVTPGSTTTYTLIAHCGSNTKTAQATITVQLLGPPPIALPDLYVSEFSLNPDPPHKSQVTQVRVGVYNQGNAASTGFKVQWYAGSGYPSAACNWNVGSLAAHGGQILTCNAPANTWGSWYGSITTRVKVDPDGSVTESNEGNNIYDKNISVSP